MLQRAARSQRWLVRQQSSLVLPELGLFEFLVLCFEQIAVAGAAMNCFQAVPSDESINSSSSNSKADSNGGNAQLLLPAVARVIPQALMVIVVLSFCIVWGSEILQWVLRKAHLDCANRVKFTARRRYLPPIISLLKLFFLVYVTLRLNDSTGLQWKQQTSALCAALILVVCEIVDVFAVAHTWIVSRSRGVLIEDWREENNNDISAKQLILTFFDRWKDCGLVTSFLSQSEITLLVAEIPSIAWASWTCCQRGTTPESISYQLHRCLTVLTIVMGMSVVLVAPEIEDDIVGATTFLVSDVVLTTLKFFEGRHRRRARRDAVRAQRLTMIITTEENDASGHQESEGEEEEEERDGAKSTKAASSRGYGEENAQALVTSQPSPPKRSESVLKQCLDFRRRGVWKDTILRGVPPKEWAFASLDCIYSLLVVLNFYETVDGSELQVMPGLLNGIDVNSSYSSSQDASFSEEQLMNEVNHVTIIVSSAFWTLLGLSLAGRYYLLYSSRRQKIPGVPHYFPVANSTRGIALKPKYFDVSVEVVKVALLPVSICACSYILVKANLYVLKQGVNIFVAGAIGAIAAARLIDAFGRALHGLGRFDGDPPGLEMFGGSPYVKAGTALQVFWDRFNDFLGPLSLDHLVVESTTASENFTVVYFLLCVCVLHAMIAYVDATNINRAVYRAERLGYLVAVTFLVRNSQKYVERQGSDLYAPVQLVAIEFFVQVWALVSHWKVWCTRRKAESIERSSRHMPMLSSISEPDEWPVLSPIENENQATQPRIKQSSDEEEASCLPSPVSTGGQYRRMHST